MTFLLLAFILATPSAQADRGARAETRQHRRAYAQLQEIAEGYWRAVRWDKVAEAAVFLGDPDDRIDWLAEGTVEGTFSYRSASVIHLEIGPGLVDDPDGYERRATVLVEIEGFDIDQVLTRQVRVQRWYKQTGSWYVVAGERVGVSRQ